MRALYPSTLISYYPRARKCARSGAKVLGLDIDLKKADAILAASATSSTPWLRRSPPTPLPAHSTPPRIMLASPTAVAIFLVGVFLSG